MFSREWTLLPLVPLTSEPVAGRVRKQGRTTRLVWVIGDRRRWAEAKTIQPGQIHLEAKGTFNDPLLQVPKGHRALMRGEVPKGQQAHLIAGCRLLVMGR